MKKINKKGFTLVELLLVIAIIGILAAVLFVSLGSQRERARITAFKEQMRALVPAVTTCLDEGGNLVAAANDATTETDICSTGSLHGSHLAGNDRNDCDDAASWYTVAVNAVGDGFTGTCTTTDAATDCVASCDAQGCSFVNCD